MERKLNIMSNSISPNQLKADVSVFVRGTLQFSRVTKHIAGEDLKKENIRRERIGMSAVETPFLTATINNAQVVPLKKGQLSLEEQYIENRFYQRANDPSNHYSIISKSPFLPWIGEADPANKSTIRQIKPEGELATGLDVMLVLRTYQAGSYQNKGFNLDGIIVYEPVRYYTSADATARMAAAGLTYIPLPAGTVPASDLEMNKQDKPADAVTNVQPPTGNAYRGSEQNRIDTHASVQTNNGPWVCQACGAEGNTGKFCQNCASPKPEATAFPANDPDFRNAAQPGGIMYNPDDLIE